MINFFTENQTESLFRRIERNTFDEYYHEIKNDIKSNDMPDINPVDLAIKEAVLPKMIYKPLFTKEVKALAAKYHNREVRSASTNYRNLYSDHFMSVNKIEAELTIEEALPLIAGIRQQLGENFFGVMLHQNGQSTQQSLNPLNPLIAVTLKNMINEGTHRDLSKSFSIIVYSLIDCDQVKRLKESKNNNKNYMEDIQALMVAPNISRGISEQYGQFRRDSDTQVSVSLVLKDRDGNTVTNAAQYAIVPVQVANSHGIMYPSYGAVLFNQSSAMNLSPFQSANVGEPGGQGNTWSNVCAGSLNSSSDTGKCSLNHSNNTSPLNGRNIGGGAIDWAHGCADLSLQLLVNVQIETETEVTDRMTFVQYKELNTDKTIKDYVEYIRDLNEKELPEWA